jgi:NAD(P)-dependent dehydrogenase (short-subunit alcohol dehydrogenase family)
MPSLFDLSGKTAIVTGSSRGIGRAIAEEMAAHGANVVISSRKQDACEEVAAAINERGAGRAFAIAASISDKEALRELVDRTRSELGPIDVLQLVRNLAAEFGPSNVRVNAIAPGLVRTDFARALWENPDILKSVTKVAALRRIGEPRELAGAAIFLASDAGSFVTGQTLVVDGGSTFGAGF